MSGSDERDDNRDDTYRVGDRHPPRHSQFKPGQSGNPKGRPKGSVNLRTRVAKAARRSAEVNQGGRRRQMPMKEIIARTIVDSAARGDLKSARFVMECEDALASSSSAKMQDDTIQRPSPENLHLIAKRIDRLIEDEK